MVCIVYIYSIWCTSTLSIYTTRISQLVISKEHVLMNPDSNTRRQGEFTHTKTIGLIHLIGTEDVQSVLR